MTAHVLQFVALSDRDLKQADSLPKLGKGDKVELRVRGSGGTDRTVSLPAGAAALIEELLGHLYRGERVALLSEDQEVTPNEAATLLGISRPLVVHRMDVGDLPFRYVGKHRRTRLKDVLALKGRLDDQRAAQKVLAEDTEQLMRDYDL
jgi:excisionase family DNA binding protein